MFLQYCTEKSYLKNYDLQKQHVFVKHWYSEHFQQAQCTVFDEESNFQIKKDQIRSPDAKNTEKYHQMCF